MDAIHILVRPDGQLDSPVVQMLRQRELDENAVDALPLVEKVDDIQQLLLRHILGQAVGLVVDAALQAVLPFARLVHLSGGVLPHQHHSHPRLALHLLHPEPHLLLDFGR